MRTIATVTVGRSDAGAYEAVWGAIQAEPGLRLQIIAAGMHLRPEFGFTIRDLEAKGMEIAERIELPLEDDTPAGVAASMGVAVAAFAKAYCRLRPDLVMVLGDRFEMHAAALAALPLTLPVTHLHGGELTLGAIDEALRHSITKLSHLHFVATEEAGRRVRQLGEEPWRVTVSGAPSLDRLLSIPRLTREQLEARIGLRLESAPLMVTYHPVTLDAGRTEWQVEQLLDVLERCTQPVIFTSPNADTGGRAVAKRVEAFVREHPNARLVPHLGTQAYASLMAVASAMVGNSSSGLIEAPSFALPVVNIGTRQGGRLRAANVIDVDYDADAILRGLQTALLPEFRRHLAGLSNPYGNGQAASLIVRRLRHVRPGPELIQKKFTDYRIESAQPSTARPRACVLGGGGHARVVIESLQASGEAEVCAVIDADSSRWGTTVVGVPIVGGDEALPALHAQGMTHFVVGLGGVGDNGPRRRLFELGRQHGLTPLTVQHPSAIRSPSARVGGGSFLAPRAVVQAGAVLGENVIVNTGAVIEHDCVVGDHAHVATGAYLSGMVVVEPGAHIGAGAVVRQQMIIGADALVGAGAVVVKPVKAGAIVVGVPARLLEARGGDAALASCRVEWEDAGRSG